MGPIEDYLVRDIDLDGIDDLVFAADDGLRFSSGASSPWRYLEVGEHRVVCDASVLTAGEFDPHPGMDILCDVGATLMFMSSDGTTTSFMDMQDVRDIERCPTGDCAVIVDSEGSIRRTAPGNIHAESLDVTYVGTRARDITLTIRPDGVEIAVSVFDGEAFSIPIDGSTPNPSWSRVLVSRSLSRSMLLQSASNVWFDDLDGDGAMDILFHTPAVGVPGAFRFPSVCRVISGVFSSTAYENRIDYEPLDEETESLGKAIDFEPGRYIQVGRFGPNGSIAVVSLGESGRREYENTGRFIRPLDALGLGTNYRDDRASRLAWKYPHRGDLDRWNPSRPSVFTTSPGDVFELRATFIAGGAIDRVAVRVFRNSSNGYELLYEQVHQQTALSAQLTVDHTFVAPDYGQYRVEMVPLNPSPSSDADTAVWEFNLNTYCGDGFADPGEMCDDGNLISSDRCVGCDLVPICGDGFLDPPETCDDGNSVGGDACSETCRLGEFVCGNGYVEVGEDCDDANLTNGDGCSAACQFESLGTCGNGVIEAREQCDDGNLFPGDGCDPFCYVELE